MTLDFLYWLFMILGFLLGGWGVWYPDAPAPVRHGSWFFWFILFLLLGIRVFGWPIKS
jgi:hypothetical protein